MPRKALQESITHATSGEILCLSITEKKQVDVQSSISLFMVVLAVLLFASN